MKLKVKTNDILSKIKTGAIIVKNKTVKHSPEILMVGGIISGVAAIGSAIYVSITKTPAVIEDTKLTLDAIHEISEYVESSNDEVSYTEEERKKEIALTYIQTGRKLIRIYSLPFALEIVSVTSFLASNHILKKRNVALAAAAAALQKSYHDYRMRVRDEIGFEKEDAIFYGREIKTIETEQIDENGKTKKKKEKVEVRSAKDPFTFCIDESWHGWDDDLDIVYGSLEAYQDYNNRLFHRIGQRTMNDVLDSLGLERTKIGQTHGWLDKPEDVDRDCYIVFNIQRSNKEINDEIKPCFYITFNVDGPIIDYYK